MTRKNGILIYLVLEKNPLNMDLEFVDVIC